MNGQVKFKHKARYSLCGGRVFIIVFCMLKVYDWFQGEGLPADEKDHSAWLL